MTIGIYFIRHSESGKVYVGKSKNIAVRLSDHKRNLSRPYRFSKKTNIHLYYAVQKYGIESFETGILQEFDSLNSEAIAKAELFWIDTLDSTNRDRGYNLRRDSSTGMITTEETRDRLSVAQYMRYSKKDCPHRAKISKFFTSFWSDPKNSEIKKGMIAKLSLKKQKYMYEQRDRTTHELIRTWASTAEIIAENPNFKWQNIHSACDGHKPTYMGFKWVKIPKNVSPIEYEDLLANV